MYLVVEFTDDKDLAVIPQSWLEGTSCAVWPPYKSSSRIMSAVMQKEVPGQKWKSFPIRELYRNEDYDKARKKLRMAEDQSDLQTVSEEESDEGTNRRSRRRRRNPNRYSESESDDSDETAIQAPPPKKSAPKASSTCLPVPPPPLVMPTCITSTENMPGTPLHGTQQRCDSARHSLTLSGPSTPLLTPTTVPVSTGSSVRRTQLFVGSGASGSASVTNSAAISGHSRDIRLFTLLEKIREEQSELKKMMSAVLSKLDGCQLEDVNSLPDFVKFPLTTTGEMDDLEGNLDDRGLFNSIVNHLTVYGGKSTKETVNRVLKAVLTNTLAMQYNWSGKKGKLPLGNLKLMAVIYKCVQRNPSTKNITQKDVEIQVKEWLRGACDREGGRKKRKEQPVDEASPAHGEDELL